jgi:hypothetical protein
VKRVLFLAVVFLATTAGANESERRFQAFRLDESRLLYRKPLLASGAAEGMQEALPVGTELLLVTTTRSQDWAFVRTETKFQGWIPVAWIRSPYTVNPVDVRDRFYPTETPPDPGYDYGTDVKVWGDQLLLEALKSR